MKINAIMLSLAVGATLLVGCGAKEEAITTATNSNNRGTQQKLMQ